MVRKGVDEIEKDMEEIKASTKPPPRKETPKQKPKPKAKPKRSKNDLWLETLEAKYVTLGLQFLTFAKYGVQPDMPDVDEQQHLAHVLAAAGDKPPLSWLQSFLRRVLPMAEPDAVPGRSVLGDFTRYAYSWHRHNPELYLTVMAYHDVYIPFINGMPPIEGGAYAMPTDIPPRNLVEGKLGERMTDEQWAGFLWDNFGVTVEEYEAQTGERG